MHCIRGDWKSEARLSKGMAGIILTAYMCMDAAAGATGSFAVQLAKLAGCHVIGTCSSDEKVCALHRIVSRTISSIHAHMPVNI